MVHSTLRFGSGYPDLSPYLRSEVQILQRALVRWGYTVSADGQFGPITVTAVRSFQRRQGLRDDGIVGPRTWTMLLSERATPAGSGYAYEPPSTIEPSPAAAPSVLSTSTTPAWMDFARNEVGQQEVAGQAANPRIIEYHTATTLKAQSDEVAWCSSFVNWCLMRAGITGTRSAAAASWMGWGDNSEARYGAILVIHNAASANSSLSRSGNHVGFLVEETSTHYVLLGGNQSNSVRVSRFRKNRWGLRACRWPSEPTLETPVA